MIDVLESHITDETAGIQDLSKLHSTVLTHPMKLKSLEEKLAAEAMERELKLKEAEEVSCVTCHFSTIVTIIMHRFEDRYHNSMH